jgi:isopenicillin N synthase-like dioxygenase
MSEPSTIPLVDISGFLSGDAAAAAACACEWDAAMRQLGLVVITGHGVPAAAVEALYGSASAFFAQDRDEKMRHCLHTGYGSGGYVPPGVEAVARSTKEGTAAAADLVENIVFSHGGREGEEPVMPDRPAELRPGVQAYWEHMRALLLSLMRLSAAALTLDGGYFGEAYARPKLHLRLAHYPALPAAPDERPEGERYGAHTDYTGFTVLRQDPAVAGLQAQTRAGEWVGVPPVDGGLVVNAGDLIQCWTNDRWRSPPHRVANPPAGAAPRPRLSLVFFTGPADATLVTPVPSCVDAEHPPRYAPVRARDHLLAKLEESNTCSR